jgi:hypothetical protein
MEASIVRQKQWSGQYLIVDSYQNLLCFFVIPVSCVFVVVGYAS